MFSEFIGQARTAAHDLFFTFYGYLSFNKMKLMHKFPLCIFFLIALSGCCDDELIEFKIEKVEKEKKYWNVSRPIFNLTLSSNEDLINLYKEENGISMYMFCPVLTGDFSIKNISEEKYKLYGYFLTVYP